MSVELIMTGATAAGATAGRALKGANSTVQVSGRTTAGSGVADVTFQVSNDNVHWLDAGNITLALGTSDVTDGFTMTASWPFARFFVNTISGTGASVDGLVGR